MPFVVRNESLDVLVHQFVGEVHAVNALHLGHKAVPSSCDRWRYTMIFRVFGGDKARI